MQVLTTSHARKGFSRKRSSRYQMKQGEGPQPNTQEEKAYGIGR
jgi:hypothetical protein